jgi:hypothetical protein
MRSVPHYLRFVRALAVVSATLPVPVALVAAHLAGCSSGSTGGSSGGGPPLGAQACQTADACGVSGGGVRTTVDAGIESAPDASLADADASDDGGDASGDASDDGGGPTRGTPELPAAWLA